MSIKARLAFNTLLVALSIGAIAVIGLRSLVTIRASIDQLTHRSAPLQVKTLQLQECVKKLPAEFLGLGMAQTSGEAHQASEAVQRDIEALRLIEEEVAKLSGKASGLNVGQFEELHQTVSKAVQEKITAVQSYQKEASSVSKALQGTEASLSGIHSQVTAMNADSSKVLRASQQSNLQLNTAVKKVLNLQYKLKEMETILSEIDATRSKYRLTPFKEKLKAASDAIQKIPADKNDPPILQSARTTVAAIYDQVTKETTGLLALRGAALTAKESEGDYTAAKSAITGSLSKLSTSLGEVTDPLELQLLKSRQAEERAQDLQSRTGQVVGSAALIEMGAKEFNSQVRLVVLSTSPSELDAKTAALKTLQKQISANIQELRTALNAIGQDQTAESVTALAGSIQRADASAQRIVTAKRHVLTSDALMQTTIERVTALALELSKSGDQRLESATTNQKDTVDAVNARVNQSFSLMVSLSVVAIALVIGFSVMLMLRITRPLDALSKTVLAVASKGDFSLRAPLPSRDEVGRTVQAFNSLMDVLHAAISRINTVMGMMAEGDFTQRVEGDLTGDLNTLQTSINTTVASLDQAVKNINTVMEGVSAGDFSYRIAAPLSGELETLKRNVNTSVEKLHDAIQGINGVMDGLSHGDFSRQVTGELTGELGTLKGNINAAVGKISATMHSLHEGMSSLAAGEFKTRIQVDGEGEFRKNLELTLQTMKTLDTVIGEANRVMSRVAVGDLTPRIQAKAAGELQRLAEGINTSLDSLQRTLRLVHDNTLQVTAASTQTSATVEQVAEGVQSQAGVVNTLAQSIGQTTQVSLQAMEHTEKARQRSKQSAELVQQGQDRVQKMLDSVRTIAEHSNEISAITEIITDIASHTQLLSLNAAIEAARAGEHGRGFAIVADEVRKLAGQVTHRADEIKTLVEQARLSSQDGVQIAQSVSEEMKRIVKNVLETDGMLQGIAAAMEQQSGVTQGMQESIQNLQTIAVADATAAEQMAAAITDLSRLATQTREQIEQFQVA